MDYKEKYDKLVEAVKVLQEENPSDEGIQNWVNDNVPELAESEGEKIRKELLQIVKNSEDSFYMVMTPQKRKAIIDWLEKQRTSYTERDVDDAYLKGISDAKNELEKQGKPKFKVGDIISNGKVVYRVDDITKNCLGQDSYFLVNVEMEKNGTRYLIITDSEGKTSYMGEITWLCEQVDKRFRIKED